MRYYIEGEYNEEGFDVISFDAKTFEEVHREHYGNSEADPYIHEPLGSKYRLTLKDLEYRCMQLCEVEADDMKARHIYVKNPFIGEIEVNYKKAQ